MNTPYAILGVSRTATADEIRAAYRRLVKQHHPDVNPGNAGSGQRFREVTAAYDLLSDPDKRARFDRGEIDATGQERPQAQRGFSSGAGSARQPAAEMAGDDFEHILADLFRTRGFSGFGGATGGGRGGPRETGGSLSVTLALDFVEAVKGGTRRVGLPDGRTLDVDLPAGLEDGGTVRLKGQGLPGYGGGAPGDVLISVAVRPHPWFRRDGDDIRLDLPVTLAEAVLGAKVRVPTVDGAVMLTVPRGSNTGTVLRLKGKGVPGAAGKARGDQYVVLRIALPERPDPALEAFVQGWAPEGYAPRAAMDASS